MRVKIDGVAYDVPKGATVEEAVAKTGKYDEYSVLAAYSERGAIRLSEVLDEGDDIRTINAGSEEGYRIYRQSLTFVLISAVNRIFPGQMVYIRQSVNRSTYCELSGGAPDESSIAKLLELMRKMAAENFPLEIVKMKKEEAAKKAAANNKELAEKLSYTPTTEVTLYRDGDNYYSVYGATVPHAGYVKSFDITSFDTGFLLRYPNPDMGGEIPDLYTGKKVLETINEYRDWNEVIGVSDVSALNKIIAEGKIHECINISEIMHEIKFSHIADEIKNDILNKKIILISGPSSSGKTTFANRLMLHLRVNGIRPEVISLDDYFWGRDVPPILDEHGKANYEDLEAIDYKLFNSHLSALVKGERVTIPRFNFHTGERDDNGKTIKLEANSVLLVEGIHALNEKLTYGVSAKNKYKVYCSALTVMSFDNYNPISPTDTRLIRRLIRDNKFRNSSPVETLEMWNSVQRGEVKNIFPYEESADVIFNSALAYEFSVYKNLATPLFMQIPSTHPGYPRVRRIIELLANFAPIDDRYIPPMSILREFVGGSSIKY